MIASRTQFQLIEDLIADVEAGRSIIPLIGSGFSVESGIPTLTGLTQYLAKVQCYVNHNVFSPGAVAQAGQVGPRSYLHDPSAYVGDFGWPDPHRLNAELWTWVDRSCPDHRDYRRLLDQQVQVEFAQDVGRQDLGLEAMLKARLLDPELDRLLVEVCERSPEDEAFAANVERFRERPGPIFAARLLASAPAKALEGGLGRRIRQARREPPRFPELDLQGNWKTLLAHLTRFNPDYVDTLFQSLVKGRQPGTTHRFLAFLTPILNLQLFLTVNFDNLLEQALRLEGLEPLVYEVSRESPLPHPILVQKELSVVKLHGGTFGLRVGEELNQPLDEDSKERLERYLKPDAVLLVMGVGGWDRRILDFVEVVARRPASRVYWMHFERECPRPVQEMAERIRSKEDHVYPVRTQSTAAFLQELYYRRTSAHPPSVHPYESSIMRPVDEEEIAAEGTSEKPIQVFANDPDDLSIDGSLCLARFVASKAATHVQIWVDLEIMHTVEDVVAEIFRQVRKYDRWLSLTVLPTGPSPDDEDAVSKAVRRIHTALSRGRYVLAFNAVESFGRPPTYHHGVHRPDDRGFFRRLVRDAHRPDDWEPAAERSSSSWGPLRDSILAFSVAEASNASALFDDEAQAVSSKLRHVVPCPPRGWVEAPGEDSEDFEALLLLSSFRRRRGIVAMRRLLPRFIRDGGAASEIDQVDEKLRQLETYVKRLEGGHYWMNPRMRNRIYETAQRGTSSKELVADILARVPGSELSPEPLKNLARLAGIHDGIAAFYYGDLFVTAQEVSSLLEHLYHRISSLRYLTKLDAWLPYDERGRLPPGTIERVRDRLQIGLPAGEEHLGGLRLRRLRALRTVLERERERLLSEVAPDTLLGWIEWIRDDDLPRFVVGTCLHSAGVKLELKPGPREGEIQGECGAVRDLLEELRADALRDKVDYRGWADLRLRQVRRACGLNRESSSRAPMVRRFRDCLRRVDERLDSRGLEEQRRIVEGLCDLWSCLNGSGEIVYAGPGPLRQLGEICSRHLRNGGEEALWVELLRCKAEYGLSGLSPWSLRTIPEEAADVLERCRWTIEACSEALEVIDLLRAGDHGRHRSYFHSLRGRACYIQGRFLDALPEIDLARVGVPPEIGANREVLAAGLLRLAELLMLLANQALASDVDLDSQAWELHVAFARRHLFRAEDALQRAGDMLAGARQNVAWWALLYQLRAQLQVEHLLAQSSETSIRIGDERERETERRRFIEQFTQRLRIGLRSVRHGLDAVPRRDGAQAASFQVTELLRIWTELMVCGGYLTRAVAGDQKIAIGDLWRRWQLLNESVGIRALLRTEGLFEDLDARFAPGEYRTGKQGRSDLLGWIRACLAKPSLALLMDALEEKAAPR